jgi:hypothetical protein
MCTPQLIILAFKQGIIYAASRNMYGDLRKKKKWTSDMLIELGNSCDVFVGTYNNTEKHYVFLRDGSLVELGKRKYESPSEAARNLVQRAKKKQEEGELIPDESTFVLKRMTDGVLFSQLAARIEKPVNNKKRQLDTPEQETEPKKNKE